VQTEPLLQEVHVERPRRTDRLLSGATALGFTGSITTSSCSDDTTCFISAGSLSRTVTRSLRENSFKAKLSWFQRWVRLGLLEILPA
jgi:hypothetical protein